ncbi:hypothetical protein [Acetobacter orientalis]|uniref:hypothetical protein n=1 Tax=Acetobacter orientalis TaxID=146474 RepID=UPI0039EB0010
MTDTPSHSPSGTNLSDKTAKAQAERAARQATALRANLRRRKQQARTRQEQEADAQAPTALTTDNNGDTPPCP